MKKLLVTLVIALTLAIMALPLVGTRPVSAQTGVALLTQPDGNVRLKRGRRTLMISEDMLLNVGDVVSVGGNGTAVIYQAYAPVTRLGVNQQFKVTRLSPPPPERALTTEEFTWFKVHYVAARRKRTSPSPATMGGPEDANLTLLEPRNSIALSRRPIFKWSRVDDATKYVVNIYDKNESVVCTESTTETLLQLPDKCRPFDPGDYKWDVTAQVGNQVSDNPALYDATSFIVITDQRAADISKAVEHARAVAASDCAAASVYASALIEFKIYPQAEAELRGALERSPKDQTLWALLIETYARMKRWRAREKAREISAGSPTAELIRSLAVAR